MQCKYSYPHELAKIASGALKQEHLAQFGPSSEERILSFIEEAFHASLYTDEGRKISFRIFYRYNDCKHNHEILEFERPIPYSASEIVKLAPIVSDDEEMAIYIQETDTNDEFNNGLQIIGIYNISLGFNRLPEFRFSTHTRPIGWMISCFGPAYIRLNSTSNLRIIELKHGKLSTLTTLSSIDLVKNWIDKNAVRIINSKDPTNPTEVDKDLLSPHWHLFNAFGHFWAQVLRNVKDAEHGGCFLVIPEESWDVASKCLKIKYLIHNNGMDMSRKICDYYNNLISNRSSTNRPNPEKDRGELLFADYWACERDSKLLSNLAQVDGAVVILNNLRLKGYGAEIKIPDDDLKYVHEYDIVTKSHDKKKNIEVYGTRHRSAFRFCKSCPGTIAFIISQDGNLSIANYFEDKVFLWSNVTEMVDY